MSSSWLADILGYGSLFEDQQPSNYYVNATKGLYDLERTAKKQEIGGERNVAEGRAAQIAAQQGITGPAAAGLSHMATEGAQRTGDIATQNIDAESRKAQYAAMLKDREYAQQVAAAREKALYEMGQKGMALAGAGLTMGTNLGIINKDTPFFGGLSAMMGNNVQDAGMGTGPISNRMVAEGVMNAPQDLNEVVPDLDIQSSPTGRYIQSSPTEIYDPKTMSYDPDMMSEEEYRRQGGILGPQINKFEY